MEKKINDFDYSFVLIGLCMNVQKKAGYVDKNTGVQGDDFAVISIASYEQDRHGEREANMIQFSAYNADQIKAFNSLMGKQIAVPVNFYAKEKYNNRYNLFEQSMPTEAKHLFASAPPATTTATSQKAA